MKGTRAKRLGSALAAVAVLAATAIPLAGAAEVSREEYTAKVEPICKANVLASKRITKGTRAKVKAGKLKPASKDFFRAATAFAKMIRKLEAVPQPTADEAKLARWLGYLNAEKGLIKKVGKALASGNKHKASSYSVDQNETSRHANREALGFDFNYCESRSF